MKVSVMAIALVSAAAGSTQAVAAITYVSQARSVSANGFVDGQFEGGPTYMANDFGVFSRTTSWTFSNATGTAKSSQFSRLQPLSIAVDEAVELVLTGRPSIEATATSVLDVTFDLPESTAFAVEHDHASTGVSFGIRRVRALLSGPGGTVLSWNHDLAGNSWPDTDTAGLLAAGRYRLQVECTVGLGTAIAAHRGTASFVLTIPAPHASAALALAATGFGWRRRWS